MSSSTHIASMPIIKRLIGSYLAPYKGSIFIAIICMIVVSTATALITYMVKPMLDEIFVNHNESMLLLIPAAIVVLFCVKGVASYLQNFLMESAGQGMIATLQKDLYEHIIKQDLQFFHDYTTGDLSSRFLFDLHRLKQSVSQCITGVMRDVTTMIGLIAVMFYHSWEMAVIALFAFPLAAYPIVNFGKRVRKYASGTQMEMGSLADILKESFMHHRQVKTYTMEDYEISRASDSINRTLKLMIKSARVRALSSPIMELFGGFSIAIIVAYGGREVINGTTSPGTFFSFLTALMTLYRPIKGIANINNVLQEGLASAVRTFELIDRKTTVAEDDKATELKVSKGEITLQDITLTYPDGTKALNKLSITIPAGKTVALVGTSGAGKSTILNLIPRFFDPTSGVVNIDGTDIHTATLKSLRQNIGLVTQEIALFNDTLANNIAYGKPNSSREEIIKAAKAAAAHEFIEDTPHGYDTIAGEDGVKLSGGQKQRIAIARAMLKNAPILLLDEATSSLDTESEKKVQKALDKLMKGRTSLVVAHRLSTIVNADLIYVLGNGKVIEQGTHDVLLKAKKKYSKLYRQQTGE